MFGSLHIIIFPDNRQTLQVELSNCSVLSDTIMMNEYMSSIADIYPCVVTTTTHITVTTTVTSVATSCFPSYLTSSAPSAPSTTNEQGDSNFFLPVTHDEMVSLIYVFLVTTILSCCLIFLLLACLCIICFRKRSKKIVSIPSANGADAYLVSLSKQQEHENDVSDGCHMVSTNTFRSEKQLQVSGVDRININDNSTHPEAKPRSVSLPNPSLFSAVQNDDSTDDTDSVSDVNNPLYLKMNSQSFNANENMVDVLTKQNQDGMDSHVVHTQIPMGVQLPITQTHSTFAKTTDSNLHTSDEGDTFDYENAATMRLANILSKQEIPFSPPPVTSPSDLNKRMLPPETKPKPQRQNVPTSPDPKKTILTDVRSPGLGMSNMTFLSKELLDKSDYEFEPHYMTPRLAGQIPWRPYKELDFATLEPTEEYMVPSRGLTLPTSTKEGQLS